MINRGPVRRRLNSSPWSAPEMWIFGIAINEVVPEKGSLGEEVLLVQLLTYSQLRMGTF